MFFVRLNASPCSKISCAAWDTFAFASSENPAFSDSTALACPPALLCHDTPSAASCSRSVVSVCERAAAICLSASTASPIAAVPPPARNFSTSAAREAASYPSKRWSRSFSTSVGTSWSLLSKMLT